MQSFTSLDLDLDATYWTTDCMEWRVDDMTSDGVVHVTRNDGFSTKFRAADFASSVVRRVR